MREDAAVVGDDVEARLAAADVVLGRQQEDADQHEAHEGGDLDDREPELHLAEDLHRDQVHGEDDREGDQRQHPLRDGREHAPVVRVERDRGDVGDAGGRPVQEVHPAGDIGALLAEELARVGHEGAGGGPVQDQLAQGPDDEEREDTADQVGQGERRARVVQASAGAEEEAGADGAADGDHVDVAGLEVLAVTGVARVRGRPGHLGVGGGLCRFHGFLAHGWFHFLVRPDLMGPGFVQVLARTTLVSGHRPRQQLPRETARYAVVHLTERHFSQGRHGPAPGFTPLVRQRYCCT